MLFALLLACSSTTKESEVPFPDASSTICGTVTGQDTCSTLPAEVEVWTIVPGGDACNDCVNDTGGGGWTEWRDVKVATLPVDKSGNFQDYLPAGEYAIYSGNGSCSTCSVVTVAESTCTPTDMQWTEIVYVDAPNVYLYPTQPTKVQVRLGQPQALSVVDPAYPEGGWRVTAAPDGKLQTPQGQRDFLYYEQKVQPGKMQTRRGWCASGSTAQASMEDALRDLGFATNEIVDFADYWDSHFPPGNSFTIYPQFQDLPTLDVSPPPDSLQRVWFYVAPGCSHPEAPQLHPAVSHGFVVREWGVALDPSLPRDAG